YMAAKARLFGALDKSYHKQGTPKVAVINADDRSYAWLKKTPAGLQWVYGLDRRMQPDVTARDITYTAGGTRFTALTPVADIPVELRLPGKHNVYNAMAAIAATLPLGVTATAVSKGLASVERIRGRMEWVSEAKPLG